MAMVARARTLQRLKVEEVVIKATKLRLGGESTPGFLEFKDEVVR